jgi:hypothetical protein
MVPRKTVLLNYGMEKNHQEAEKMKTSGLHRPLLWGPEYLLLVTLLRGC